MSTTTNYYALTKPELSDPADIRAINGNMDTLDTVLHGSQVSLADAYDQTATYNTGDVVMYEFLMYKCKADGTTGNWDASKWERTTAAETGGGEVDFDLYGEASGNPASFADGSASALVECEVEFEPKQDLHGYSKPWAGGAGKNKIPLTVNDIKSLNTGFTWIDNSFTYNGVTVTLNTDSDGNLTKITTSGICSGNFSIKLAEDLSMPSGTYILSGSVGGTTSTYYFQGFGNVDYTSGAGILEADGETTFTLTATNNLTIRLHFRNTANMTGVELYPMVRASGESSGFEPYSNICPIEGHDDITINVSPTNDPSQGVDITIQLGDTYYSGTLNAVNGELTITYGYIASYNGETLTGEWLSDRDEYTSGGTPTTGAEVVYELATPITVQIPPTTINTLLGQNYVFSEDAEDIDLVYVKATAPIKPNPSGEADGYLSSIELSGEKFEIIKELPTFPTSDGDYKLKLSVSSGVPTLSWVSDT